MTAGSPRILRTAFLLGAITDAGALLPMVFPSLAEVLWGIRGNSGAYRFAMGYGASLMLGWTALLIWAYRRPIERRFVAPLTMLVILGLAVTEAAAAGTGLVTTGRMMPTWALQAALFALFAAGYRSSATPR